MWPQARNAAERKYKHVEVVFQIDRNSKTSFKETSVQTNFLKSVFTSFLSVVFQTNLKKGPMSGDS